MTRDAAVRIGIGGPVGSGKTALVDTLCKRMRERFALGVVTNDIFTREDMEFLVHSEALPSDRSSGVQTGGCPQTAIREDASMNFEALEELTRRHPHLDVIFLESGGDNLAASFSPELVDAAIYVIDVSGGDKIPRKGGPGVTRSDLLVINKTDLAAKVGASLEVMARDSKAARGDRPFLFTNLKTGEGVEDVIAWIQRELLFDRSRSLARVGRNARSAGLCTGGQNRSYTCQPPFRVGRWFPRRRSAHDLAWSAPGFSGDNFEQRSHRARCTSPTDLAVGDADSSSPKAASRLQPLSD